MDETTIEDAELVEDDEVVIPLDEKVEQMIEACERELMVRHQIQIHPWVRLGAAVDVIIEAIAPEGTEARAKLHLAMDIRYLDEIQQIVRDVTQRQLTAGITDPA